MAFDIGSISSLFPSSQNIIGGVSSTFFWVTILIIIFLFLVGGAIGVWFLIRYWQFNKKLQVYEDRGTHIEYVGMDRAKEIVYNNYGDSVFYLKKRKKYLPRGEVKVGKKVYMYIIRKDGEWINVSLEGLDNKLNLMNIKMIHPDMRAFKSGMAKLIKDRFEKKSIWKEYGHIIIPVIVFIICGLILYFIADKLVSFLDKLPQVLEAATKVQDATKNILVSLENVCSGAGVR